jgi:twitching motility protein PilT
MLDDELPDIKNIFEELLNWNREDVKESLLKSFSEHNDICFTFDSELHDARLRITIYKDEYGTCIAVRIIPFHPMTFEQLGLPEMAREVCDLNRGLFVVTGASGSGKSTTLAAMLSYMNKNRKAHIITIEDPIEYVLQSEQSLINHREVGRDTKSFQTALHWILREDPNVVVLGELRDTESMRAAIQIAETGHLVLATLHTRNAVSTLDRFIGSFPPEDQNQIRMMLADNLVGVLAQTLIPRRGGGMIGAFEVLRNTDAMKNNIREQKIYQIENILQTGQSQGMISMEDYIIELLKQGFVDYDNALKYAPSRRKLTEKCERVFGRQ